MQDKFWQSKNISERFECLEKLGEGGMGIVFKVQDKYLKKQLAVKILKEVSPEQAVRLQREAIATAKLQHANILEVYDLGLSEDNQPYMVLEYVTGDNLADYIKERGRLSVQEALELFLQICAGMGHAHSKGVLHRDLKPGNVLLVKNSQKADVPLVKVADFGLARLKEKESTVTQSGRGIGSPYYMSPEQADGVSIDERSDIYSMGCLMYEALAGKPPFVGGSALETIAMHQTQTPPKLATSSSSGERYGNVLKTEYAELKKVPKALDKIIQRCLEKDKEERISSFKQLENDLLNFVDNFQQSSVVDLASYGRDSEKVDQKSSAILITVSALVVVLLFGAALFWFSTQSEEKQSQPVPKQASEVKSGLGIPGKLILKKEVKPNFLDIACEEPISDEELIKLIKDEDVQKRKRIDVLQFHDSQMTGENFDLFKGIEVEQLGFKKCSISDKGLGSIARLNSLRSLSFEECDDFSDAGLANLRSSKSLESIFVESNVLSDQCIAGLDQLPNLSSFGLKGVDVTPKGVRYLAKIPKLKGLSINFAAVKQKNKTLRALASLKPLSKEFHAVKLLLGESQLRLVKNIDARVLRFTQCSFKDSVSTKEFLQFDKEQILYISDCHFDKPLDFKELLQKFGRSNFQYQGGKVDKGPDAHIQIFEVEKERLKNVKDKEKEGGFFF